MSRVIQCFILKKLLTAHRWFGGQEISSLANIYAPPDHLRSADGDGGEVSHLVDSHERNTCTRARSFQRRDVSKRQNETIELNFINVTRWQNDLYAQDYDKRALASNAKLAQTEQKLK